MLPPPRPATSSPSPASALGSPSPGPSRDSEAFRSRLSAREREPRKPGETREREPRKARRAGSDPEQEGKDPASLPGLLARADGVLVVSGALAPLLPTRAPRGASAKAGADGSAVALTDVKVGGPPGSARLHATLAEGRHTGVELRAVERDGRVTIELHANTPEAERALRAEMPAVREALAARGLDGVAVEVHTETGERHGRDPLPLSEAGEGEGPAPAKAAASSPEGSDEELVL